MTNKEKFSITLSKNFSDWLQKKPDFNKNFSGATEHYLKLALRYDQKVCEEDLEDAMEIEELRIKKEKAIKEHEDKLAFVRWKREQKELKA